MIGLGLHGLRSAHSAPRLWDVFRAYRALLPVIVGCFGLETAVRKMTGLPASRLWAQAAACAEGAYADLTLFTPRPSSTARPLLSRPAGRR